MPTIGSSVHVFNRFWRAMDASEIAFAGIARQAELLGAGELSSRELVQLYLQRIERSQPRLNAFRVVFARPSHRGPTR